MSAFEFRGWLALAVILCLVVILGRCTPAQAAMEPEEIMVRLATGLQVPPAYRQMVQRPRHRARRPR